MRKIDFENSYKNNIYLDDIKIILGLIDFILNSFFIPDKEKIKKLDINRVPEEILNEPIDWERLYCFFIEKESDYYKIYLRGIDDSCQNLIKYIENLFKYWGWNIKIVYD